MKFSNLTYSPAMFLWKSKIMQTLGTFAIWLASFGALGLFALSFLDSALIPVPSGPDLLLIKLSVDNYQFPFTIIELVLSAAIGSTIGCTILFFLAKKGGERVLRKVSEERKNKIESLLGRYDALAILVTAILPPPFPFKPFILCAGVFNFKLERFILGLFIGKTLRFAILGFLAFYFGEAAKDLITKYGPKLLLGFIGALALAYLANYLINRRRNQEETVAIDAQ
jgi:membrane protein YqaA with SNARE-associated domain